MLKIKLPLVSLALMSASPGLFAEELVVNGFMSVGAGVLSNSEASVKGYDDDISFSADTVVGVQLSKQVNDSTSATTQLVSRGGEDYDTDGDAKWLKEMSTFVNACDLVKYQWGHLGTQVEGVSYKLFLSQNDGEKTELETITIPQKVIELPRNSVLSVQACVNGNCGEILEMPTSNLTYPMSCKEV